ncbi:hypothetical protein BDB01DRAFT_840088 [Pilobolus umbonatus]|nr:hypothetical protein BDB01DRAFT_840088 [Pilobolus umbonatus]
MSTKIIPDIDTLTTALDAIKLELPNAGTKTLFTQIQTRYPDWQVSDKRIKKIMQSKTKVMKSGVPDDPSVPVSFIDPQLDFKSVSDKVVARMIDPVTGKGLFAACDIKKDETIFTETPFVYFPPWEIYSFILSGNVCGLCCKPIMYPNRLTQHCGHCGIYYCSKQCRVHAWDTFHPIECYQLNPEMRDFMQFCQSENWQAPAAVARIYSYLSIAHQKGELDQVVGHLDAFATVSQEERQAKETEWIFMEQPTRELWSKARQLLKKAIKNPPPSLNLFDEETFLHYLGKFNINNQNGGLYLVHSHINHNCYPNVSIDYPQPKSQYRLAVRAIRDIKKGEQLFETYVNPRWNKETRVTYLDKSYLFKCQCERCETDGPLTDELRKGLRLREE